MTEHLRGRVHTALSYICVTLIPKRVNRVLLLLINVFGTLRNQQFSDDNVSTKVVLPHRTRVSTLGKVGLVTAEASESTSVSDREVNKHVGPDELRAPQASTSVPPQALVQIWRREAAELDNLTSSQREPQLQTQHGRAQQRWSAAEPLPRRLHGCVLGPSAALYFLSSLHDFDCPQQRDRDPTPARAHTHTHAQAQVHARTCASTRGIKTRLLWQSLTCFYWVVG